MNLYLGDLCATPGEFERVYNYEELVVYLQRHGLPDFISFGHDLGEGLSGYGCARYLVDYCLNHQLPLPKFVVHGQNPVSKASIERVLVNFKENIEF